MVNAIFNPLEAELILNIPLSRQSTPDGWMWKWEKRGYYSVKSGYKELSRDKDMMCRGMYHHSSVWNSIWSVTAPPKVKNFLWRACPGSLPTKQCLISRKVEVSEACPICHGGAKSVFHLLTSCPFGKEFCCVGPYHVWVCIRASHRSFSNGWRPCLTRAIRKRIAKSPCYAGKFGHFEMGLFGTPSFLPHIKCYQRHDSCFINGVQRNMHRYTLFLLGK